MHRTGKAWRLGWATLLLMLALATAARADNRERAEDLRARLKALPGFTAVYEGKNEDTGQNLRIEVLYRAPDRVRMDVVTQKFTTSYDGRETVLYDFNKKFALSMSLDRAKSVLKAATRSFQPVGAFLPEAGSWTDQVEIHPFFQIDLSEGSANLAVTFGARPQDAPWLNRLAENPDQPEVGGSDLKVYYGEYTHVIDTANGMLKSVEQTVDGKVRRSIRLASFEAKAPADSAFVVELPAEVTKNRIESDANAVEAVARSQFNLLLEKLLTGLAPKWNGMTDAQKRTLSDAVRGYWRTCFESNAEVRNRLLALIDRPESLELIGEELGSAEAFADFQKENPDKDEKTLRALWPNYVAASLTQEILKQTAEPYKVEILERAQRRVFQLAKANNLTEEQANDLLQKHTEGIVIALVEAFQVPIRERIAKAVEKVQAEQSPVAKPE